MFAKQRLEIIRQIIKENTYADVSYLSEVLGVSEVTVRRDLSKLESEGFLTRSFGGAIISDAESPTADDTESKRRELTEEGQELQGMAQLAIMQLSDQDVVFIGAGEECLFLANSIPDTLHLTVISNSLDVALALYAKTNISFILVGGTITPDTRTTNGLFALQSLQSICMKCCFVSVDGVSLKKGYSVSSFEDISLLNALRHTVENFYILVSGQKLGCDSNYVLGDLTYTPNVIAPFGIPEEYKSFLFTHNIRLYTALS